MLTSVSELFDLEVGTCTQKGEASICTGGFGKKNCASEGKGPVYCLLGWFGVYKHSSDFSTHKWTKWKNRVKQRHPSLQFYNHQIKIQL